MSQMFSAFTAFKQTQNITDLVKKLIYLLICIRFFDIQLSILTYTILPKVLGHPLLMKGLSTLVISMSTNLNV